MLCSQYGLHLREITPIFFIPLSRTYHCIYLQNDLLLKLTNNTRELNVQNQE